MNDSSRQVIYELARTQSMSGWWLWALLVLSLVILLIAAVRLYRRDAAELSRPVRWTLITLRLTAIVALVFFFLDAQRRTQRSITRPSEVVVLVDTSQSMSLPAYEDMGSGSRAELAAAIIKDSEMLDKLSAEHRVSVYAFGENAEPRLLQTSGGEFGAADEKQSTDLAAFSPIAMLGMVLLGITAILSVSSLMIGASGNADRIGWMLFATAGCLIVGCVMTGSVYSIRTQYSLAELIGLPNSETSSSEQSDSQQSDSQQSDSQSKDTQTTDPVTDGDGNPPPIKVSDWNESIAATDAQSRIGDAIRGVLVDHDPTTLAGIILMSDGQSNGGSEPGAAVATARRNEVAVFPVGLGSSAAPTNLRVVNINAPQRVYPSDKFAINAVLQASGAEKMEVEVQLLDGLDQSASAGGGDAMPTQVVDSQKITVTGDGTLKGVRFELEPQSVGRRRLAVRVVAPEQDRNEADDIRDARYEVVARRLRVLTIAGGPTREYRFVRNLLYRDKSVELDTWLQTGQPGMSQDADKVLSEFPKTAEELFEYDAIAMFDPDWTAINQDGLELLDRWVGEQAGGLIIVGGPVYHPRWLKLRTDARVPIIKGFFPVNFPSRGPLIGTGRQGGENAWPLKFTPEARRAEFLWLVDRPDESFQIWNEFSGVYDYVGVSSTKPGTKVYAYFSDPTTAISDSLPVYLASQFYGAGRVFFQGSGEMWRLRRTSDAHFDSYYTKLIRWVCEGRLLRDSNRGRLLVENQRAMIGDTITVRAVLSDDQFEPLVVPEVQAKLLAPSGRIEDVRLLPVAGEPRPGTYGGRFLVREAGSYELRLTLGDALNEEVLRQTVQVSLPTVELERPRRNDDELKQYASTTGGVFLPIDDPSGPDSVASELVERIRPQPQTTVLPGTADQDFAQRRNLALMWLIASVLTMEWVTRRLHRLA
ncbi:VWA domain-containing protein [Stieleria varia]|uniref:von Willebrand factor type A domain protein n=1 Tax=Stieleria varia TaxID=2528005 RepID=A0A5C6AVA6_9BACT|nr:VWA domain-containing protein [Stieleria varia]TWU02976.1 hypothetical protein Pla52n_40650 [Stieleria varia]